MTVLDALREIATSDGVTVVLTVHQPSTPMWQTFDKLLLMAPGGETAYFGEIAAAAPYFAALGHPCGAGWSEQDHFVELVSDGRRDAVVAAFAAAATPPPPPPPGPLPAVRPQPPLLLTVRTLLRRAMKNVLHTYLKPLEWALTVLLALVFGLLWWRVGAHIESSAHNYISIIFFFVAQWSWAPLFQASRRGRV